MALSVAFLEELRARTPLVAVVGRKVKLARSSRQMKGCCPFHNEKTPSFQVYEDGYHCFGCGAHGDAITFVMQTQGAGFMEAVEQLAAEAGLEVPKSTPEGAAAERRQHDLRAVLETAGASYQRRLALPEGQRALAYLRGRGLSEETVRRFGLGWSGEGRGALSAELSRDGIAQDRLVEAGLMRRDDVTGRTYDLFFNRVMFPIRDRSGRVISFGGGILGDGQPKYINGLWRLSPSPVLCFDGDAAGGRGAAHAAELALPLLAPDRTLQLATLPAGEDPDTLVRRQGVGGFQVIMSAARPLVQAPYELLREADGQATPEQRAAFRPG
jgi:DNA primase